MRLAPLGTTGSLRHITCIDYHTAGEPFRIVTSPVDVAGATVAQRREHAPLDPADMVRRLLCFEPRGHADMYGCFICPPDDDRADFGALFWHKDGYSTACGHGTIALGTWAVQSGRVATRGDGITDVSIDVPSGRVLARVLSESGAVSQVTFRNVPSYVLDRNVAVSTLRGPVRVGLVYGGAIYATVPAAAFGLSVEPANLNPFIEIARSIKIDVECRRLARHAEDARLSGLYGTIFFDELNDVGGSRHQRNVTIFADGEVDRSPCGSGTSGRVAQLVREGKLALGDELIHESIIGTTFRARAVERVAVTGTQGVITEVIGAAYRTGGHEFSLDPQDPLGTGFVLR